MSKRVIIFICIAFILAIFFIPKFVFIGNVIGQKINPNRINCENFNSSTWSCPLVKNTVLEGEKNFVLQINQPSSSKERQKMIVSKLMTIDTKLNNFYSTHTFLDCSSGCWVSDYTPDDFEAWRTTFMQSTEMNSLDIFGKKFLRIDELEVFNRILGKQLIEIQGHVISKKQKLFGKEIAIKKQAFTAQGICDITDRTCVFESVPEGEITLDDIKIHFKAAGYSQELL